MRAIRHRGARDTPHHLRAHAVLRAALGREHRGVAVTAAVEAGWQFGQGAPGPQSAENLVESSRFHLVGAPRSPNRPLHGYPSMRQSLLAPRSVGLWAA